MTTDATPGNVRLIDGLGPANEAQPLVERLRTDVLWHQRRGNETIARDCQEAADEIERLRAGYDRYEVVRRMNVSAFQDAYVLNRRTGKPFDEIVAEQAHFYGLRVRA